MRFTKSHKHFLAVFTVTIITVVVKYRLLFVTVKALRGCVNIKRVTDPDDVRQCDELARSRPSNRPTTVELIEMAH